MSASRWHLIDQGVSLPDHAGRISADGDTGTAPALILINNMTNDAICGCKPSDARASVTQAIASLRAAAPAAVIAIAVPFGLANAAEFPDGPAYARAVRHGATTYQAAVPGDDGVVLLDLGDSVARTVTTGSFADPGGVHPNARGHAQSVPWWRRNPRCRWPTADSCKANSNLDVRHFSVAYATVSMSIGDHIRLIALP